MTNCWSEGALRAYLDRELSTGDMKSVAAHLGECSACDGLCAELSNRAARVFAMIEELPEPGTDVTVPRRPVLAPRGQFRLSPALLWPAAAVALAAGLAIASFVVPKRPKPVEIVQVPVAPPSIGSLDPAPPQVAQPVVARTSPRKRRPSVAPANDFVALDDEPIESGVIMRVELQPGNAKADVIFDPAGRARAIRLVSNKY